VGREVPSDSKELIPDIKAIGTTIKDTMATGRLVPDEMAKPTTCMCACICHQLASSVSRYLLSDRQFELNAITWFHCILELLI